MAAMRNLLFIAVLLFSSTALAGLLPEPTRNTLLQQALSRFWGRAKISDGSLVQPENEEERNTLPVSRQVADQVMDVGEVSGLAHWCGLEWLPRYLSLTAAARKAGLKEKQVAFVGFLHGAIQGYVIEAQSSYQCTAEERTEVAQIMQRAPEPGF